MIRHHREVQAGLTSLAEILARGFLRLTQKRRSVALSDAENPQIPLDVWRPESPPVSQEIPQWKRPCSVKSTGFDR